MTLGQKVKPHSIPRKTGFGSGSSENPRHDTDKGAGPEHEKREADLNQTRAQVPSHGGRPSSPIPGVAPGRLEQRAPANRQYRRASDPWLSPEAGDL
jgi:hypothetical protein